MKKSKNDKHSPQYITNEKGEKISVILPIKEYLKLLEAIEENEDIRLYDEVKSRNEKRISLDEYLKKEESPSMPLYKIEISETVVKQLDKLPQKISNDLIELIRSLAENPRPWLQKTKGKERLQNQKRQLQDHI